MNRKSRIFDRVRDRKLIRWQELVIGGFLLLICAVFLFYQQVNSKTGTIAYIYLDSEQIMTINLDEDDYYRIDLMDDYGVPASLEFENGGVSFVDVTCPDHLCEKTGRIYLDGQTAVCMPNRVAVKIVFTS